MDDFKKYADLKEAGATPGQVYRAGKEDHLDEITLIRLLRKVFDLSLADAKRAIVGDDWPEAKQEVKVGSNVDWDGWDTLEGSYLMEGRVVAIEGPEARLEGLRKYKLVDGELVEVVYEGPASRKAPVSHLERPLVERLQETALFLSDLPAINDR